MFDVQVSVVIPALNEADSLPHVLRRVPDWVHEVILVDGYSSDGTVEVARQVMQRIRVIYQEGSGKGAALRTGVAAASGEIVVMLDADGSTDPAEVPAFVGALLAGADIVKGSRFVQGGGTADMPRIRQLANWGFVIIANTLFRTQFSDITYGYRAAWRHCADALALEIDGWENESVGNVRAARLGLKVVEVASFEHRRFAGEAKLQAVPAGWVILKGILAERWKKLPARIGAAALAAERNSEVAAGASMALTK